MKKWEYTTLTLYSLTTIDKRDLDELGKMGWECYCVYEVNETRYFYLKREIKELQQETTSPLYKYNCSNEKESLPEPNWKENKRSK